MAFKFLKTKLLVAFIVLSSLACISFADTTEATDVEVTDADVTITEEDVLNKIEQAQKIIETEDKEAFKARWDAMSAQEKHDYLLPTFLDELRTLHTQLLVTESNIMNGKALEMSFVQFYVEDIDDFLNEIFIISNVDDYEYSAYRQLKDAAGELEILCKLLDQSYISKKTSMSFIQSDTASTTENDYDKHTRYFNEFYSQAYEIELMREYGIEVDKDVDRNIQELTQAHKGNLARYKVVLNNIVKCAEVYSSGKTDSDLYDKVKNASNSLYVGFQTRDTYSFASHKSDADDTLTPLANKAAKSIEAAAEATGDFTVYAMIGQPERGKAELDKAIQTAKADLKAFEDGCTAYEKQSEKIDVNIFDTIADIKAERQKTAEENGFASWESYQKHLEEVAQEEMDARINEKATELAVEQKKREEELRRLEEKAHAEWLANRLDFSKSLSNQKHPKSYYMSLALSNIENDPILSGISSAVLELESIAFDQLFQIRANGGNTKLLQELYDAHPDEYIHILDLYYAFR